jgi:mannosyltransferase
VGYLAAWPRRRPQALPFALALAVLVLPYLPLAAWQAPLLLSSFQTGHPYYPLGDMLSILARGWNLGILASAHPVLLAPFALAAAGLALRPRLDGSVRFLLCWLSLPILVVHLVSLRSPIFTDRYLIASLPALLLLLALGVGRVWGRSRPVGAALALAVLVVSLYGLRMQGSFSIKTDTRGAADIVRRGWQQGDVLVVQIPYLRYSLDYYLGQGYPLLEGPYTNDGFSPEDVDRYLRAGTREYERAWLMLSEAEMWDQRGLTETWFQEHASQAGLWELARVRLYLFELP